MSDRIHVCVLVDNENVENARNRAVEILGEKYKNSLPIPLSVNGEEPVTHWFCTFRANPEFYAKLLEIKEFTEITASTMKDFLEEKSLNVVRPVRKYS